VTGQHEHDEPPLTGEQRSGVPDESRLALDRSVGELIRHGERVLAAQGRLRGLLRASQLISGDLDLSTVLHRIVQAACELVEARYGALAVLGADRHLDQFIQVGMDTEAVARIGHLPEGKGLLGALIEDPHPIRLARLDDDQRSIGFPAGHPLMTGFLGVPIRVRGEVYGNLYLTERAGGQFSDEDEELVLVLATAAGVAIDHARLYEEARQRQEWLQVSTELTRQVLSEAGEDPLRMLVRRAHQLAGADHTLVALTTPQQESLIVEAAAGPDAEDLTARSVPLGASVLGTVVRNREPVLHHALTDLDHYGDGQQRLLPPGPAMIVPLIGADRVRGALAFGRGRGRAAFSAADLDMALSLANHAALALEMGDARTDRQQLMLLEDRDRIASDLHDHVIQRLFAASMDMQSLAANLGGGPLAERMLARVDDLDDTIRQIRTSIFELHGALGPRTGQLRARLLAITTELTESLGFAPHLTFAGPLDLTVPDELADDLTSVAREALSNIARHAHAHRADITLTATTAPGGAGTLTLAVSDDGVGLGQPSRGSGLTTMRQRAEHRGGTFTASTGDTGGTRLTWTAPLEPIPRSEDPRATAPTGDGHQ